MSHLKLSLQSAAIILAIIGTWLVAIQILNVFHGFPFILQNLTVDGHSEIVKSEAFAQWEASTGKTIYTGLILITMGGALELYALFLSRKERGYL